MAQIKLKSTLFKASMPVYFIYIFGNIHSIKESQKYDYPKADQLPRRNKFREKFDFSVLRSSPPSYRTVWWGRSRWERPRLQGRVRPTWQGRTWGRAGAWPRTGSWEDHRSIEAGPENCPSVEKHRGLQTNTKIIILQQFLWN